MAAIQNGAVHRRVQYRVRRKVDSLRTGCDQQDKMPDLGEILGHMGCLKIRDGKWTALDASPGKSFFIRNKKRASGIGVPQQLYTLPVKVIGVTVGKQDAGERRIGTAAAQHLLKQRRRKTIEAAKVLADPVHKEAAARIFDPNACIAERCQL